MGTHYFGVELNSFGNMVQGCADALQAECTAGRVEIRPLRWAETPLPRVGVSSRVASVYESSIFLEKSVLLSSSTLGRFHPQNGLLLWSKTLPTGHR